MQHILSESTRQRLVSKLVVSEMVCLRTDLSEN